MKILAPLNNIDYLDAFIEAGADEFFLGFYEEANEVKFGRYFELNRMSGFRRNSSRFTFEEIKRLVKEIKSRGKSAYITFNSSGYTEDAIRYMEPYIEGLVEAGVDGFIVSCLEMMDLVHRKCGNIIISGIGTTYNQYTAEFYKKYGAQRIILPRDLTMEEIKKIIKTVPGIEYEVFIMRNGCILSDGNCLGLHLNRHGGVCKSIRESEKVFSCSSEEQLQRLKETQRDYDHCLYKNACGICAIFSMIHAGVNACKVVGRLDNHDRVLEDIRLVKENINIALSCKTADEYLANVKIPNSYKEYCTRFSCYYPEIVANRL